ncbi:hypothetical protein KR054_007771 [Drosophila jambulina]|nr:hypothetical protein KR054_007771 [Drosophila jambulina]
MKSLLIQGLCLIVSLELGLANPASNGTKKEIVHYCKTFDQKPGKIIHINDCHYMLDIVVKLRQNQQLTEWEQNVLKFSRRSNFSMAVCCEDLVNTSGLDLLKENEEKCGLFVFNTISEGIKVNMGSRPWMALLAFNNTDHRFQCGATLITPHIGPFFKRFSHCRTFARLGEHKISEDRDCKIYTGSEVICMPPPQDIAVEKTIVHPNFIKEVLVYDIALIRLKTPATITDYVRTICLPLYESVQKSIRESNIQKVTGWGLTSEGAYSDEPNEASVSPLHLEECRANRNRTLLQNQLCFSASGADSCAGDSGGPLSYTYRYNQHQRFVQTGIVSYGPGKCGTGPTAVYTDVISFLPWITQNIEP